MKRTIAALTMVAVATAAEKLIFSDDFNNFNLATW